MVIQTIFWSCTDSFKALVSALKGQARRMKTAGFCVEVATNDSGFLFSSKEFGHFILNAQQVHGAIEVADATNALGMLMLFGVHANADQSLLLAGSDGVPLNNAQRLYATRKATESLCTYDAALLLFMCGLSVADGNTPHLREAHSTASPHQPSVNF